MTDGSGRDDATLAAGLTRWFAHHNDLPGVELTGFQRPSAGFSSDTVFFDAAWTSDGARHERALVLRMAPPGDGTFPHYDLTVQWQAQQAAVAAGVPVADPVLEPGTGWIGTPFLLMPRVEGHLVGGVTHRDRWLLTLDDSARGALYRDFVAVLSRIHRSDVPLDSAIPRRDNGAELDHWDAYLTWSSGGSPVATLVDALGWCRDHRPAAEPEPALLWGDARLENAVIGDDLRVRAVLDWDMTSIGAPEHDLAWFTGLDLTMGHLFGERTAGFPDRAETIALFEGHCGRPVEHLAWYETLAMVRSTAVMTRLGYLQRDAGRPLLLPIDDNPILDLLRGRLS